MSDSVLVTGAFGLVGSQTVRRLAHQGHRVVASDLDIPAHRAAASKLPSGIDVRWADLTDVAAVEVLVGETSPAAIVHLAAVIPPVIYRNPRLGRTVNVDATKLLVSAAERLPEGPRFIQVSSNAVHGARNPYRTDDLLTADTPVRPCDLYGAHKVAAENLVRASSLNWVVARLGGVLSVESSGNYDLDSLYFGALLPTDGRVHTVDVRDVATALTGAVTAEVTGETLFIGGDSTHHLRQGELAPALASAAGLVGAMPVGLPGDPDSDSDWFATDWMDTSRAQNVLLFQHHSWSDMLAEVRTASGWRRYPLRLASPLAKMLLQRRAPYRGERRRFADPWGVIRDRWGEPQPVG